MSAVNAASPPLTRTGASRDFRISGLSGPPARPQAPVCWTGGVRVVTGFGNAEVLVVTGFGNDETPALSDFMAGGTGNLSGASKRPG